MSFLEMLGQDNVHIEQIRNAWKSLTYDILTHRQYPVSPPLTPGISHCNTPPLTIEVSSGNTLPLTSDKFSENTPPLMPDESCGNTLLLMPVLSCNNTSPLPHGLSSGNKPPVTPDESCGNKSAVTPDMFLETAYVAKNKPAFNNNEFADASYLRSEFKKLEPSILFQCNSQTPSTCWPPLYPPKLRPITGKPEEMHHYSKHTLNKQLHLHEANKISTDFNVEHLTRNACLKRKHMHAESKHENLQLNKKIKKNGEEVICQVNGLLSLSGCREPKYNVTVEELKRRVNQPECLTKVDMISYVRLAKNSARTLLENNNIITNSHNRRSEHTVLSKMCESETAVLANGIREMNFHHFPGKWFAEKSVAQISKPFSDVAKRHGALMQRLKEDEVARCVLLDVYIGLEERCKDREFQTYNLISHSFGIPNLQNHILFLLNYLDEELRLLKACCNDASYYL